MVRMNDRRIGERYSPREVERIVEEWYRDLLKTWSRQSFIASWWSFTSVLLVAVALAVAAGAGLAVGARALFLVTSRAAFSLSGWLGDRCLSGGRLAWRRVGSLCPRLKE
jgi:hypothetical protein